jgi:hypothetical protein
MSVESAADRAALLADFGVSVSWKVGAAAAVTLTGIFDNGTVVHEGGEGLGMLNRRATLTLREADVPAGTATDVITIAGVTYHPKNSLPDGTGMVVVTLERIVA